MSTTTSDVMADRCGVPVLVCAPDGPPLRSERDAVELIGAALAQGVALVALPVGRLDGAFFRLHTGLAGAIMQKFVTYRLRLAIVGDVAQLARRSAAWRGLVAESNRGDQVWFVSSLAAVDERLTVPREAHHAGGRTDPA